MRGGLTKGILHNTAKGLGERVWINFYLDGTLWTKRLAL